MFNNCLKLVKFCRDVIYPAKSYQRRRESFWQFLLCTEAVYPTDLPSESPHGDPASAVKSVWRPACERAGHGESLSEPEETFRRSQAPVQPPPSPWWLGLTICQFGGCLLWVIWFAMFRLIFEKPMSSPSSTIAITLQMNGSPSEP